LSLWEAEPVYQLIGEAEPVYQLINLFPRKLTLGKLGEAEPVNRKLSLAINLSTYFRGEV
jgi:hypothetical protein